MKNNEIRKAIKRLAYIKSLQSEAKELRQGIITEMEKRRKDKINLGGPNEEDYVCLREKESSQFLTYKICFDESNQVRGIDL